MKTLFHLATLSLLTLLSAPVLAQEDDLPMIPEDRLQEIKAQKTAFLTQRLDLTPEEAQRFWPIYNLYEKEQEAVRKEMREHHKSLKKESDLSEAEASAAIDKELASRQKELDIRKKYAGEFKKAIGSPKTMKLGKAERDFHRELIKRVRDRMDDRRDGPPGDGPGGRRRGRP